MDAPKFHAETTAVRVVAGLIVAQRDFVIKEVIEDLGGDIEALGIRTSVAGPEVALVGQRKKLKDVGLQELARTKGIWPLELIGGDCGLSDVNQIF
jgi:hypothetical protein